MTIEIQFRSVLIQPAEMQNYPGMFSAFQQYLPAKKSHRRRRPRKKRETVGHLIDALKDSIEGGRGD